MRPELIVAVGVFLACLGVTTATPMFPAFNRPAVFRGKWGESAFMVTNLVLVAGTIGTILYSFINLTWYVSILLLVGALVVSSFIIQFVPAAIRQSAAGPIIAALGFVALRGFA